jgi:hypothetical protein
LPTAINVPGLGIKLVVVRYPWLPRSNVVSDVLEL